VGVVAVGEAAFTIGSLCSPHILMLLRFELVLWRGRAASAKSLRETLRKLMFSARGSQTSSLFSHCKCDFQLFNIQLFNQGERHD
jgi:hypothetical protein